MGKASMLAIVAFTVMGAIYGLSIHQGTSSTHAQVSEHQQEMMARNASVVGMDRAKAYVSDEYRRTGTFTAHTFDGEYESITYKTQVCVEGNILDALLGGEPCPVSGSNEVSITSVGVVESESGRDITYTLRSNYREQESSESMGRVPRFMEPVLLSDGSIEMKGNTDIDVLDAEGNEENRLNADIHSNSNLTVNGNAHVRGFGTASESFSGTGNMNFDPYANPNNAATTEGGVDPIEIPPFNATDFVNEMDTQHGATVIRDGDVTITGSDDGNLDYANYGGTRENPTVWHIDGKLDITGSVQFPEYLVIVTEEGFEVNGNITMGEDAGGGGESTFGIYTAKDGVINDESIGSGDLTIYGQIFGAEGVDVNVAGNFDLYGNMTAGGLMNLNGNIHARYVPASPALTGPWNQPDMELRLVTHNEW